MLVEARAARRFPANPMGDVRVMITSRAFLSEEASRSIDDPVWTALLIKAVAVLARCQYRPQADCIGAGGQCAVGRVSSCKLNKEMA